MITPNNPKRINRQTNLTIKFTIPILAGRVNSYLGFWVGAIIFAWEFLANQESDREE